MKNVVSFQIKASILLLCILFAACDSQHQEDLDEIQGVWDRLGELQIHLVIEDSLYTSFGKRRNEECYDRSKIGIRSYEDGILTFDLPTQVRLPGQDSLVDIGGEEIRYELIRRDNQLFETNLITDESSVYELSSLNEGDFSPLCTF